MNLHVFCSVDIPDRDVPFKPGALCKVRGDVHAYTEPYTRDIGNWPKLHVRLEHDMPVLVVRYLVDEDNDINVELLAGDRVLYLIMNGHRVLHPQRLADAEELSRTLSRMFERLE